MYDDDNVYAVQGSVEHCVVGVQILYHLVMEMNLPDSMRSVSTHRKRVPPGHLHPLLHAAQTDKCP